MCCKISLQLILANGGYLRLILKPIYLPSTSHVLSSQESFVSICHSIKDDWVIIDNQQAGKYHEILIYYIYLCNYFPIILSIFCYFLTFLLSYYFRTSCVYKYIK